MPCSPPLPLTPLKSLTGFAAATVTAATVALRCWDFVAPIRNGGYGVTSAWQGSIRQATSGQPTGMGAGGLLGLLVILVAAPS
jgi:diacylglycerol kinase (CTP)